jgi:hypothetical protein
MKLGVVALLVVFMSSTLPAAAQEMGWLVLDVKRPKSTARMSKAVQRRVEHAGFDWGVKDGQVVLTLVKEQFVNFDLAHFTRFGETKPVEVPAGEYRITCVGFENEGALLNPEKALDRGAYLNVDVLTFRVEPGGITKLEMQPVIKKQAGAFVNLFIPTIQVTAPGAAAVTINARTDKSVPWSTYAGTLKLP